MLSSVAMTKAERRRAAASRVRNAAKARQEKLRAGVTVPVTAWASQRYLGNMPTPGFATMPLNLSLGIAAMLYDFTQNPKGTGAIVGDVGVGLVAGQLAVDAYKKRGGAAGA